MTETKRRFRCSSTCLPRVAAQRHNPRSDMKIFALCMLHSLVIGGVSLVAADRNATNTATGTWKWKFTMPDGTTVEPRVKLQQSGEKLTGTTRFREGFDAAISDGKISGEEVSF